MTTNPSAGPSFTRRGVLAAAGIAGATIAVAAATPAGAVETVAAASSIAASNRPGRDPLVGPLTDFLQTMTDAYPALPPGPRLPQSYADELGLFSTAFIYDSALAVCAAIAAGRRGLATSIADGIVFAQANDPVYDDGRLRQGYNVGPYTFYDGSVNAHGLVLPDGTANIGFQFGFLGTAVGDMAWPGIALAQASLVTGRRDYLEAAKRIGRWIIDRATNPGTLGGFSFGVNGADASIPNCSTEHNIDCTSFFGMLATLDRRDRSWRAAADRARAFVERVWEPTGGYFYTGSNDGSTINRTPLPLDPQAWSWLALRDRRYAGALDWAASNLATTDRPDGANSQLPAGVELSGVTFSSASLTSTASYNGIPVAPNGVWLEGTAQLVSALRDRGARGDRATADRLQSAVTTAVGSLGAGQRVGGAEIAPRGVVAASSLLDSGFGFGYFQIQHVGATAWSVMAAAFANPMQLGGLLRGKRF
ncbi:MAG: hypothetical protein RI885_2670 [Actinomycetota bacterium]